MMNLVNDKKYAYTSQIYELIRIFQMLYWFFPSATKPWYSLYIWYKPWAGNEKHNHHYDTNCPIVFPIHISCFVCEHHKINHRVMADKINHWMFAYIVYPWNSWQRQWHEKSCKPAENTCCVDDDTPYVSIPCVSAHCIFSVEIDISDYEEDYQYWWDNYSTGAS